MRRSPDITYYQFLNVHLPMNFPLSRNLRSSLFAAAPATISVRADQPGHAISPLLWGVFFEDINLAADGGLYPELVRNRSFEGRDALRFWSLPSTSKSAEASWLVDDTRPLNASNRHCLRVNPGGRCMLENEGYWGMNFLAGDDYVFELAARASEDFDGALTVQLCDASGTVLDSAEISGLGTDWERHSLTLKPSKSDPRGKLRIAISGSGSVFLDMISLMPAKTWKNHGLRLDLAEAMEALKPAFFRFPGGCLVEGDDMANAYRWKDTIGDIGSRTPQCNLWGYNATNGIGYHEYLQLAEDLGAEPLFCINAGMSHTDSVPMDRMGEWVQDALDAIEYANGPVDSVWGSLRAKNGHPEPFNLRYFEIGNENGGNPYAERWPLFVRAIKAKYPEMILIADFWGGHPTKPMPEIVDEHYYDTPEWFLRQANRFDTYDREGPKVFVGEYAVTKNTGDGNLRGAIGEAAFMIGMERNSDVVVMSAYAPLFCNANHKRWPINLINFDSSRWFGIPSYYVQKMFAENRGAVVLPVHVESPLITEPPPSGRFGVGTWRSSAEFKDIKVTAPDGKVLFTSDFSKGLDGWETFGNGGEWSVQNGVLRQEASHAKEIRAFAGDISWTDYTITLKARKIGGRDGFLVPFHIQQNDERMWWNLGGNDNTQHTIGPDAAQHSIPGTIETGRWYDVRLEIRGTSVKGWLDGKLVQEAASLRPPLKSLAASATRDDKSGDIVLKVVNGSASPLETEIDLQGTGQLSAAGKAIVLTSDRATDENTFDQPTKVSPKTEPFAIAGNRFTCSFPANSFTLLRIPTRKQ
jgi:alpha-L-arabinofuranosidase